MTGFKTKEWILERLSQVKAWGKPLRVRLKSLTGTLRTITRKLPDRKQATIWLTAVRKRSELIGKEFKSKAVSLARGKTSFSKEKVRKYRIHILGAIGLSAVVWTGVLGYQQYVEAHTYDIYHVYVKDQYAGTVSDPQVVDQFKISKYKELEGKYPNAHMILNADEIVLKPEKAYKGESNDSAALAQLDQLVTAHAVGVELVVDGKPVGIVKDQDTAEQILSQVKSKYGGSVVADESVKKSRVSILSAPEEPEMKLNPGESEVEQVEFVEQVETVQKDTQPDQLDDPEELLEKLETGDVQPTQYTVQKGDSISKIAQDFNISRQVIYENNPWIVDDFIKIGQVLDLTVLQPAISVRTVEKVVESQEIQYDTDYVLDDSLREGVVETISAGKNGLKNVTFLVTKVNGKWIEEEMLDEEILVEPVTAKVRKGTKVVLGEGSGKFAWPVLGSSISSGFGYRWGKLHKGVDLTASNKSILAADNGKVEYAGYKDDYGYHVIINHMNGYKTLYGHLSSYSVTAGQIVEKGEKIGVMGSTGDSTGVHLHFEVIRNGTVENPLKYLNR